MLKQPAESLNRVLQALVISPPQWARSATDELRALVRAHVRADGRHDLVLSIEPNRSDIEPEIIDCSYQLIPDPRAETCAVRTIEGIAGRVGRWTFPAVEPGTYRIEARAATVVWSGQLWTWGRDPLSLADLAAAVDLAGFPMRAGASAPALVLAGDSRGADAGVGDPLVWTPIVETPLGPINLELTVRAERAEQQTSVSMTVRLLDCPFKLISIGMTGQGDQPRSNWALRIGETVRFEIEQGEGVFGLQLSFPVEGEISRQWLSLPFRNRGAGVAGVK